MVNKPGKDRAVLRTVLVFVLCFCFIQRERRLKMNAITRKKHFLAINKLF